MTKSRMRRTGSGYKASVGWVTRPGTGKPDAHSERHAGKSDAAGRRRHVLPREVSNSVQNTGLPSRVTEWEGAGEVSRSHSSSGASRPLRRAESSIAGSRLMGPMADSAGNSATSYRVAWATMQQRGGTDLLYWWRLLPSTALNRKRALAAYAALPIEETAVYVKYVRWCGRTGP